MNAIELNHACTYATPEELEWLTDYCTKKTYVKSPVVMIGAGPGVMAVAMLEGNPTLRLTVIDKTSCEYVKAHISQAGFSLPIELMELTFITSDSVDASKTWHPTMLDLLIIDGDHSYEGVKRDLNAWLVYVKPNGLVFLHDYDADGTCFAGVDRYPGVKQAIEECSAHWEEFARVGTAMVMKVLE